MKLTLKQATDSQLFAEIDKCKTAKVLLSKTAFNKTWKKYQEAIQAEIDLRNADYADMSDDELLAELGF